MDLSSKEIQGFCCRTHLDSVL